MTLSSEYEIPEVVSLAKAAQRFLVRYLPVHSEILQQKRQVDRQSPDTAGFRKAYGSHYKPKLE